MRVLRENKAALVREMAEVQKNFWEESLSDRDIGGRAPPCSTTNSQPARRIPPYCLVNQVSQSPHRHSRKRQALTVLCHLLSPIIPNSISRRIFPNYPPISMDPSSGSRATRHLDTSKGLHVHRFSTPPIAIDGPSGSRVTHHLSTLDRVSPCDKRTSYVPCQCLRLLLTCVGRLCDNRHTS